MGKQTFKYILMCMAIYLGLSGLEILLKPLINLIDDKITTSLIVYNVFLLIINPIATKLIISKIFKFEANSEAIKG